MWQERDSECHGTKLTKSEAATFVDRCSKTAEQRPRPATGTRTSTHTCHAPRLSSRASHAVGVRPVGSHIYTRHPCVACAVHPRLASLSMSHRSIHVSPVHPRAMSCQSMPTDAPTHFSRPSTPQTHAPCSIHTLQPPRTHPGHSDSPAPSQCAAAKPQPCTSSIPHPCRASRTFAPALVHVRHVVHACIPVHARALVHTHAFLPCLGCAVVCASLPRALSHCPILTVLHHPSEIWIFHHGSSVSSVRQSVCSPDSSSQPTCPRPAPTYGILLNARTFLQHQPVPPAHIRLYTTHAAHQPSTARVTFVFTLLSSGLAPATQVVHSSSVPCIARTLVSPVLPLHLTLRPDHALVLGAFTLALVHVFHVVRTLAHVHTVAEPALRTPCPYLGHSPVVYTYPYGSMPLADVLRLHPP